MNARLPLSLRGLAVLLFLAVPTLAQASTLNVPSANYPTIQSAIYASQDGDTVLVADGTYTGGTYTGESNRDIDFYGKNITVKSQHGAAKTIIDCQGSASSPHRGFYIHSGELKATISGFTVKNGYVYGNGGGIDSENSNGGTITITGCIVSGNIAAGYGSGGGIFNLNNSGTVTITNCIVTGNSAAYQGGGIYYSSYTQTYPPVQSSTVTLTGCTVTNNTSQYSGGGVSNTNGVGCTLTLDTCTVTGNTVTDQYSIGGGVENFSVGTIVLTQCAVSSNSASFGGGVFNNSNNSGIVTLSNCTITKNTAPQAGGSVENYNSYGNGTITLAKCTITANSSSFGGGAYSFNSNGGTITLAACTVSGNTAQYSGGGFGNANSGGGTIALANCVVFGNMVTSGVGGGAYNSNDNNSGDIITLTNCTFTGNDAAYGSGSLYNDNFYSGTVTLTNDIAYGDRSIKNENPIIGSVNVVANNCDIQGGYPGTGNIDADPLFIDATAGDVHLKPGSPCLGAGTANGAPATDKDGQFRPNPPSIGAYELKVPPAIITSFSLSADQIDAPGTLLSAFVTASGTFSKVTVSVPRGSLGIVSPTFTLTNYGGPYWYGTIPTAFLKLAKTNPVTFIATGTRADGTTATLTTTLKINNRPTLSLYLYPDTAVVPRNNTFNLYSFVGNFTGVPALYTTVQITLPPGIDYVSSDGAFTYNAATRTLTQGFPSLFFQQFNLVLHVSATASTQKPLTIPIVATCPGFQQAVLNSTVQVVP